MNERLRGFTTTRYLRVAESLRRNDGNRALLVLAQSRACVKTVAVVAAIC